MGLTASSVGRGAEGGRIGCGERASDVCAVALAGNPNVGKSTVFNALTGLHQHTGNWPGKTVTLAQGRYEYAGRKYLLFDLPGTYSLDSRSEEERAAAEFLADGGADCVVVVCDGTCLERNLLLVFQILERTSRVIVCVNLLDEAKKKEIRLDLRLLERELGVPVVGVSAGRDEGLDCLRERIRRMSVSPEEPMPNCAAAIRNPEKRAQMFRAQSAGNRRARRNGRRSAGAGAGKQGRSVFDGEIYGPARAACPSVFNLLADHFGGQLSIRLAAVRL
jgi:ferrous iron transport protein B